MGADGNPWSTHRRRAEQLRGRYPFAAEVLGLYTGLLDGWQETWTQAREDRPAPADVADWAVSQSLPRVVKATEAHGPAPLARAIHEATQAQALDACAAWLAGEELGPAESYLSRASLRPVLAALDDAAGAFTGEAAEPDARRCPRCGGLPQLSVRSAGGEALVSGGRHLACSRCEHTWPFSVSSCAFCGETAGAKRTLYAEHRGGTVVGPDDREPTADATHPHIRIEACSSCQRYLLEVELGRDPAAVPEVDELAAVPLALYAGDQGLTKITPNLMGF
jgi:formate dehydrogenase maturation protein FdhE